MMAPKCPICGGTEFIEAANRPGERCTGCRSLKRTRAAALFLQRFGNLTRGSRVLHFAPEPALAEMLSRICGDTYEIADVSESRYRPIAEQLGVKLRIIDLCKNARDLPSDHYDIVTHHHVLEHVGCNWTIVLQQLHRTVRPGGAHLFSFPISAKGYFREDLERLPPEDRTARFGRFNHVRRFGRKDLDRTLGAVFEIKGTEPKDMFTPEELNDAAIGADFANMFFIRKESAAA